MHKSAGPTADILSFPTKKMTNARGGETNTLPDNIRTFESLIAFKRTIHNIMHQSIPAVPRSPGLLRGICLPRQSRGWGICKFFTARRPSIFNPGAIPKLLNTHAVSYQNITTQRVLLEKKQIGSSVKDRNKLKTVVKAFSRFHACISSLLIKPELHSKTRKLSTWINVFLVIESSFSWYYLKKILSYFKNYS